MKKTVLMCVVCLILILTTTTGVLAKTEDQIPARVKVISQSCMADGLCLTVIDLDQNEVVILFYSRLSSGIFQGNLKMSNVIRTGMFVDPDEQEVVTGQDAPIVEEEGQSNDPDKQNSMNNSF